MVIVFLYMNIMVKYEKVTEKNVIFLYKIFIPFLSLLSLEKNICVGEENIFSF